MGTEPERKETSTFIRKGNLKKFLYALKKERDQFHSKPDKKFNEAFRAKEFKRYLSICIKYGRTEFFKPLFDSYLWYGNKIYLDAGKSKTFRSASTEMKIEMFKAFKAASHKDVYVWYAAGILLLSAHPRKDNLLLKCLKESDISFYHPKIPVEEYHVGHPIYFYYKDIPILKFVAAYRPDLVEEVLEFGVEVNDKNICWFTAMHEAICAGQVPSVEILLQHGAVLDGLDGGVTLLMMAAVHGRVKMAEYLLSKGFDINQTDNHGRSAFIWAVIYAQIPMIEFLITAGAATGSFKNGKGPMHWTFLADSYFATAAETCDLKSFYEKDGFIWQFPIKFACEEALHKVLDYLVTVCDDEEDFNYAMWKALIRKDFKAFEILGKNEKLPVNCVRENGDYPLRVACGYSIKWVKKLIQLGADVTISGPQIIRTPLAQAIRDSKPDIALFLLENGAKASRETLRHAAFLGFADFVIAVIQNGCELDDMSSILSDPYTHIKVVRSLIEYGAEPVGTKEANAEVSDYLIKFKSE